MSRSRPACSLGTQATHGALLLLLVVGPTTEVGAISRGPSKGLCWINGGAIKMAGGPGRHLLDVRGAAVRGAAALGPARRVSSSPTMVAGSLTKARRAQNVAGNLFVDESCIDCDTCRWMQGETFAHKSGKSAVVRQPATEDERRGAYRAMHACPTSSIRVETSDPVARDALKDFPFPVDSERLPGVFHLGFHGESSFGCSPWLVQRPEGNVMMDSPRFHPVLAKELDAKGGVSLMVLSHIDDVGDHQRWKERFPNMKRVMHKADVQRHGDTRNIEIKLDSDSADGQIGSRDYWQLGDGLRALHTPGHSKGSITLLYDGNNKSAHSTQEGGGSAQAEGIAFTGDHLALSGRTGALTGFPRYGYDLAMQSESIELLARSDLKFRWILPGHGRMIRFKNDEDRASQVMVAAANTKAGRA